jgi:Tfp pilus assembly protein PilF
MAGLVDLNAPGGIVKEPFAAGPTNRTHPACRKGIPAMPRRQRLILCLTAAGLGLFGCAGPQSDRAPSTENLSELIAPQEQYSLSLAQQLELRGEDEEAEAMYRTVLRDDPNQTAARHRLGVLAAKRGDLTEGERHLRLALEDDPHNVKLLNDIGYCCYLQKRFNDAEALFRRAMELDPAHETSSNNLSLVQNERKRSAETIATVEAAEAEEPRPLAALADKELKAAPKDVALVSHEPDAVEPSAAKTAPGARGVPTPADEPAPLVSPVAKQVAFGPFSSAANENASASHLTWADEETAIETPQAPATKPTPRVAAAAVSPKPAAIEKTPSAPSAAASAPAEAQVESPVIQFVERQPPSKTDVPSASKASTAPRQASVLVVKKPAPVKENDEEYTEVTVSEPPVAPRHAPAVQPSKNHIPTTSSPRRRTLFSMIQDTSNKAPSLPPPHGEPAHANGHPHGAAPVADINGQQRAPRVNPRSRTPRKGIVAKIGEIDLF